ncbi:MAG: dihydropteroate synthase [Planctomycetota bacterium]|nr:dihydropteroate synthase [Planctomycetota bacterium]
MFIAPRREYSVPLRTGTLALGSRTAIMGIVNVTPDSFSDGGKFKSIETAVSHALQLEKDGADIIDIGGESTRPGAESVDARVEMDRVIPVIREVARTSRIPISIDTAKSAVARAAVEAGACIVNDITALRGDPGMVRVIADSGAAVVVMHMQGVPRTMQVNPVYTDVVAEVVSFLRERKESFLAEAGQACGGECVAAPVAPAREETAQRAFSSRVVVDPGIGFGKTTAHNLEILARLDEFAAIGCPVLIGTSRKSFLGHVLGLPVDDRVEGTAASVAAAIFGGAHILRVHDVLQMRRVADVCDAIRSRVETVPAAS